MGKPVDVQEAKDMATQLLKDARAAETNGDVDDARVCRNMMNTMLDSIPRKNDRP